jgi:hypothetical protein
VGFREPISGTPAQFRLIYSSRNLVLTAVASEIEHCFGDRAGVSFRRIKQRLTGLCGEEPKCGELVYFTNPR